MSDEMNHTAGAMQEDIATQTGARDGSGRFAKGQSGNPGGRAKMPPEVREMLTAKAQDAVQVITKFLGDGDPRVALKAAELLLDRAYGKPVTASEPIAFDAPPEGEGAAGLVALHAALLHATAKGQIAVSDAKDVSGLFEAHRRMIETSDLEARLTALEAKQA